MKGVKQFSTKRIKCFTEKIVTQKNGQIKGRNCLPIARDGL